MGFQWVILQRDNCGASSKLALDDLDESAWFTKLRNPPCAHSCFRCTSRTHKDPHPVACGLRSLGQHQRNVVLPRPSLLNDSATVSGLFFTQMQCVSCSVVRQNTAIIMQQISFADLVADKKSIIKIFSPQFSNKNKTEIKIFKKYLGPLIRR